MSKLPGNRSLCSESGLEVSCLAEVNMLGVEEKERIYAGIIPRRVFDLLNISPQTFCGSDGRRRVSIIAPRGMGLARIEVRHVPEDRHAVFFLDIADTHFRQMELAFCVIKDPFAPHFDVDLDIHGNDNCFTTLGRNIPEEIRAMQAGLYPNQVCRGLRMFGEFFHDFERFVDSLGMDMIVAEPLTYDNAIRYEGFGFDYLNGRRMMEEINREFQPGRVLHSLLNGSSPFRMPGMERTVFGRSWAIHDGILDEPWDDLTVNKVLDEPWEDIKIYKMVGQHAGLNSFPERQSF